MGEMGVKTSNFLPLQKAIAAAASAFAVNFGTLAEPVSLRTDAGIAVSLGPAEGEGEKVTLPKKWPSSIRESSAIK